jgi:DNA-directed RNA polymerase subunit K/omega
MTEGNMEAVLRESAAELIREHRGMYRVINAVSRRVRQLQLGEKALAYPPDGTRDVVKIAFQEFVEEKVEIVQKAPVRKAARVIATAAGE